MLHWFQGKSLSESSITSVSERASFTFRRKTTYQTNKRMALNPFYNRMRSQNSILLKLVLKFRERGVRRFGRILNIHVYQFVLGERIWKYKRGQFSMRNLESVLTSPPLAGVVYFTNGYNIQLIVPLTLLQILVSYKELSFVSIFNTASFTEILLLIYFDAFQTKFFTTYTLLQKIIILNLSNICLL